MTETQTQTQTQTHHSAEPAFDLSKTLEQAVSAAGPSVVRVSSPRGHGTSGTVWTDDGLILTTHRGTRRAAKLGVRGADEREREATIIGRDPGTDLVLLRTDPEGLGPIARAQADEIPGSGALAVALARPGWRIRASLRAIGLVGPSFRTPSGGRIDAWIETDRSLPRGFSGGPLIDPLGRMIGLDSRGLVRHADLAVPLVTIERIVAELVEHGAIRRGWLGVSLVPVELPGPQPGDHDQDQAGPRNAVLVAGLAAGGPAAKAGVLIGDLLLAVDGAPIAGPSALREALRGKSGETLALSLSRAGAAVSSTVVVGETPD